MIGQVNVPGVSAADLAKVNATAEAAKAAADKALEGGGGNVIKITFGAEFIGAEFTVTDGASETKTGTVPDTRVVNVGVTGCNTTYTIEAAAGGITYTTTVTTGPYYGQYSTALNVFAATIKVTTAPGAVVTATCDGVSFNATANSSGLATVAVKKSGTYSISATLSGQTSTTTSATATTDGGTVTATVRFVIANVPSQSTVPGYTGRPQSPSWNNYNSSQLTLGGTTSGTDAGEYSANFTPKTGFQWPDGGVAAKTVKWRINQAAGSVSLSKTSLALTGSSPNGSFTVTRAGTGAITATSSNTDVCTVSVSGTTVTVNGVGDGSARITVRVAADKNYTAPADATCNVTATDMVHIYGASWDGTSTTKWTRTDDAAGFTDPVPAVNNGSGSSPFDGLQPWAGMVKSERTGGTMVAIPKFWYKITQNGAGMKIQIADKEKAGFSVSPAHMDKGDGKGERDVVYIGRYHCHTSDWKSKTGGKPKVNVTRSAARSGIHGLGANIWQMDFAMRFTIWLLYIVEFADWNSQAKIGYGCGNNSAVENMGKTDSMKYHTGTAQSNRTTYGVGVQYRWIEGLWDNCYDWCDGCYNNSSGLNIILNPNSFSDSSGGTLAGKPSNGYPSAFSVKTAGFAMFIPTAASGSDSTYSCDDWYFSASYPCVFVGGYYYQNSSRGLFCVDRSSSSGSVDYIGCRLQELP